MRIAQRQITDPRNIQARLFRWRKLFWLAIAVVVFLAGDTAMSTFGPPTFLTALVRALIDGDTPVIATGASFSVPAGSFATLDRAAAFAAALDVSGLPILLRRRPDDGRYQVLVGPYVATDEAEHAQRRLAAAGLGEARLVVDDTMRGAPQRAAMFGGPAGSVGILIVAAPGMSSVVFEMRDAPREVEARRTSATTLDIDIGRVTSEPDSSDGTSANQTRDLLSMPEGLVLARELSVESAGTGGAMRARLVVADGVQSRVRLEGQRVYVDLAWPQPPWQVGTTQRPKGPGLPCSDLAGPTGPALRCGGQVLPDPALAYREQLQTAVARFEQIQPFLISAAESPEPAVLSALSSTLQGVGDSMAGASPPPELAAHHRLVSSSIALAAGAVAPSFAGDRQSTVRQAIGMFKDATR